MTDNNTSKTINPSTVTMAEGSNMTNEVYGMTQFLDDAGVKEVTVINEPSPILSAPVRDQSLTDFFERPTIVGQYTWSTAQAKNTEFVRISPITLLTTYAPWVEKLKGFNLVRGTCVIRVVINANPFQQGKLLLSFIPCFGSVASEWRTFTLCSRTIQPNVELDCRETAVALKAPYITPYDYAELHTPGVTVDWGTFFLTVLSELDTGASGETTVNVTVFASFEDIELAAPVAYAQSGAIPAKKKSARPKTSRPVSVSGKEAQVQAAKGSISSGLMTASKVTSSIASVPQLGAVATAASWILRGSSGLASWFGWSKPHTEQPAALTARRLLPNMANATGVDMAAPLSLFHDFGVNLNTTAGDDTPDEMCFNFIKVIPAYVNAFEWDADNAPGTILYTTPIEPKEFYAPNTLVGATHTLETRDYVPFAFVSHHFAQYRGSIKVMFKFAKTEFHSGRLEFTYYPTEQASIPAGAIADTTFAMREIVDLRIQSEICLTMPYLLTTKYQKVGNRIGTLQVKVLNELRAPETASQRIQMLIYAAAGDDYELQIPCANDSDVYPIVPQMGDGPYDTESQRVNVVVGGYSTGSESIQESAMCVGECFTSVKQLISRYAPVAKLLTMSTEKTTGIYPYAFTCPRWTPTMSAVDIPQMGGDPMSNFGSGYAFFKGGVRILQTPLADLDASSCISVNDFSVVREVAVNAMSNSVPNRLVTKDNTPFTPNNWVPNAFQMYDSKTGVQEYAVPYSCRTPISLMDPVTIANASVQDIPWNPQVYVSSYYPSASGTPQVHISRSARDNFQFSYFLGFPHIFESLVAN